MRLTMRATTARANLFQSTHPVWDATPDKQSKTPRHAISIHASRMGCDADFVDDVSFRHISIHASRMGCDLIPARYASIVLYFNPRIPYGMRHHFPSILITFSIISIHASRMGCDLESRREFDFIPISIHASRMGCDRSLVSSIRLASLFQSTHPVWDATVPWSVRLGWLPYFNPRIPYGMRRG